MTTTQSKLSATFPHLEWNFDVPLAPRTYMKIGGPAEALLQATDVNTIKDVITFCTNEAIPVTILGGASNVIISDDGVRGLLLFVTIDTFKVLDEKDDSCIFIQAGAGIKMAALVSQTVSAGATGLEYFLGVPGTLGGAIYNNAHYLTDLIGTHVESVHVLSKDGTDHWVKAEDCAFAYEHSRFQNSNEIILEVIFKLKKGDKESSLTKIAHATQYRAKTQPLGIPSSGCIFQNVPNTPKLQKQFPDFAEKPYVPGGYIIDQAHLKGTKIGGIQVSTKHAAWFENDGTGTSQDVKTFRTVKDRVKKEFDVELHEEVFYLE